MLLLLGRNYSSEARITSSMDTRMTRTAASMRPTSIVVVPANATSTTLTGAAATAVT